MRIFRTTVIFALSLLLAAAAESQTKRENLILDGSLNRTFTLNSGGTFTVENHNGDIAVESWDRDEVEIEIIERHHRSGYDIEIEISARDDIVRVKAIHPNRTFSFWNFSGNTPEAEFRIRVPKRANLEVESHNGDAEVKNVEGDADVRTHNGAIRVSDLTGRIDVESHNGDIRADNMKGSLTVASHNAGIDLDRVIGDVFAESHNGDITLLDVEGGDIEAETYNGRLSAEFSATESGRYDFSTHNGRVDLRIPRNTPADFDVRMDNRSFSTDFRELEDLEQEYRRRLERYDRDDDELRIRGVVNGGGARISITSHNGGVHVRAR